MKKKIIMISIPVLVMLVLVIFSLATQVTISTRTWQLDLAYYEDSHERVAYGPNSDNNTYKKMDVVLEAKNGEITITNHTLDKVYKGTYDASQKDRVTIEGAEGTARLSSRRRLSVSVGGYHMDFYATDTDVWDRIEDSLNSFAYKYGAELGIAFLELVFFGVALLFSWDDIKNKFRGEEYFLSRKAKWLSLTSFIGAAFPLVMLVILGYVSINNEALAWIGLAIMIYTGIGVAFIGPVFSVSSLLYSIAYTVRVEKKRKGIIYIVLSSLALISVSVIAVIAVQYI